MNINLYLLYITCIQAFLLVDANLNPSQYKFFSMLEKILI